MTKTVTESFMANTLKQELLSCVGQNDPNERIRGPQNVNLPLSVNNLLEKGQID